MVGGQAGDLIRGFSSDLDLGSKYIRLVSLPNPAKQVDPGLLPGSVAGSAALSHYSGCQKWTKARPLHNLCLNLVTLAYLLPRQLGNVTGL